MNYTFKTLVCAFALLFSSQAFAQESWSLERCIRYAQDNNLTIKQAQASVRTSLISESQAKASRLPNLSANVSGNRQFGRTIDPTTNTFGTTSIGANSLSLSAGVNVFSGGQIHHGIKQATYDRKASEASAAQSVNNLALQVAQAYLNVLLFQEQLESAQFRAEQSRKQLDMTLKMISAGSLPAADRFNIDAEIARNEQAQVAAQNNLDLAYLNLKQLLQLEPDFEMAVEHPTFNIPSDATPEALFLSPIYQTALGTQPSVEAADWRIRSAEEGIDVAKSAYYPTISIGGSLSTNYSTAYRQQVIGPDELVTQTLLINGQEVSVGFYQPSVSLEKLGYGQQLDRNFGQSVGVQMSIPIYSNGRNRLNVERARLNVLNAELESNQTRQTLKNDIQTAIANARAGKKQLEAAEKTAQATRSAYENAQKRFELGNVNTLDLTTAKNNLDIAENDLIVAKYDYIFKLKILDFYQGKPIELK